MQQIEHDLSRVLDPALFAGDLGLVLDPWQCELVRKPPRRGILNCSRQSGKTEAAAVIAAHRAIFYPDSLIVVCSPAQRQSDEFLRRVRGMLARIEQNPPDVSAEAVRRLELRNGSRILSLPGGTDGKTIRGIAGVSLAIFDEAARCPDELFAAVRPMLATKNGSLILLSTPAGKRGQFYEIWHNGDPAWARIRVSADQCPRISAEFLAEERRELGEARFAEEYQLAFLDSNEAAFSTAIIDAALSHEVRPLWG